MAEYRLITVWHIEAPLEAVYAAVSDPLRWPEWWPDAQRVVEREAGAADGVGRRLHCAWQGRWLPYRLQFDLLTTQMKAPTLVVGEVKGDLEGFGRCLFSQQGAITTVQHEWYVRTTRRWMNLLAFIARPLFTRNHALAMQRGGEGLAARLGARLLGLEHGELAAPAVRAPDALAALAAGLLAGVLATVVQMILWWLASMPVVETLWRDTQLTAAIVLGTDALTAPPATPWTLMLVAALIHFMLSGIYGLVLARFIDHLPVCRALLVGGCFGAVLYVVNLYGFALFFPWFAVTRDGITALTHVAFGILLAGAYVMLRLCRSRRSSPPAPPTDRTARR
ncbi:MAG: SRPBCC family protein [Rhodocyclaceae bacterium]|nr:SRPBCC family protein [Rhodocyclaceae bacterium]MDZ4214311.1 SRPBCC family protein [Rhodocyclaceae bacterium]